MAGTIEVAKLVTRLEANSKQYTKGLNDAISKATSLGVTWDKTAQRWRDAQGHFTKATAIATHGLNEITEAASKLENGVTKSLGSVKDKLQEVGKAASAQTGGLFGGKMGVGFLAAATAGGVLLIGTIKAVGSIVRRVFTLGINIVKMFASGILGAVKAVVTLGIQLGKLAARGLAELGKQFVNVVKAGAPLPGIITAFNNNARRFGVNLKAMQSAAGGTVSDIELMKNANLALTAAGAKLGVEFGKNLPVLLAGARAAARGTGKDVGFLFESLVSGVKRTSPLLIDNTGIVLKLGEANKQLADELGKTVKQLTSEEKQIAILNATVRSAKTLIAQTGGIFLTAADKMAGLGVQIQNLKDRLGVALNPILHQSLDLLTRMASVVLPAIESIIKTKVGPALSLVLDYFDGWVTKLEHINDAAGTVVRRIGGEFEHLPRVVGEPVETAAQTLERKFLGLADKALTWGVEFMTEFAVGLVRGASIALQSAMKFISGFLTGWFKGQSPPKIMPNLDKWAQSAMNLYLHNMTLADFGILEGMQGPISTALSRLVDAGDISQKGSINLFKSLSEGLNQALVGAQKTGKLSEDIINRLQKAGGAYGKDLAELAKRQFKLAAATTAVKEAEEALERARSAQKDAQGNVTKLAREYNKLLAAGADPAILEAKRKEFEVADDALDVANDLVSARESEQDALEAAKKALGPLQEQVALQQKVLDQMFKMTEPWSETEIAMTNVKEKTGEIIDALEKVTAGGGGLGASLVDSMEQAKLDIQAKFKTLFDPVKDAYEQDILPKLQELAESWRTFRDEMMQFWLLHGGRIRDLFADLMPKVDPFAGLNMPDAFAGDQAVTLEDDKGFLQGIVDSIGGIGESLGEITRSLIDILPEWKLSVDGISVSMESIATSLAAFADLVAQVTAVFDKTRENRENWETMNAEEKAAASGLPLPLAEFGDKLEGWASAATDWLSGPMAEGITKGVDWFTGLFDPMAETLTNLKTPADDAAAATGNFVDEANRLSEATLPTWMERHSPSEIEETLMGMSEWIGTLTDTNQLPKFIQQMGNLGTKFTGLLSKALTLTSNLGGVITETFNKARVDVIVPFTGAIDGMYDSMDRLIGKIGELITKLEALADTDAGDYNPGSPSPFEVALLGISARMSELSARRLPRLIRSLHDLSMTELPNFNASMGRMPQPAWMGADGSGTNNEWTMTVHTNAEKSDILQDWNSFKYRAVMPN